MNRVVRGPMLWLLVALPIALAATIYHPYRVLPLDVWDFREFLPILQRATGAWPRFIALLAYYSHHGRMNPLFYATFVLQYGWFHTDPSGWQWLRFIWMSLDTVLVVLIARRTGLRLAAGVAAAALLVTATSAVRAWVQLMGEPQALAAILAAAYVALNYQTTRRWQRAAAAITLLVAVAFLSKEVVGSLGVVVLLLAVFWQRSGSGLAIRSRRNVVLAMSLASVAAGELILLLAIRSRPEAIGYGMAYGKAPVSLAHFAANLVAILLPVRPGADARLGLLYPANVLAILVLALGLTAYVRRHRADFLFVRVLVLGTLPVLIGAAVYLPWPKFDSFYGLPFLVGPLLLYAAAIDELLAHGGVRRYFAVAVAVLVPCYTTVAASRSVETAAASLRLNADLARLMGHFAPDDSVLVLSPPEGPHALPVKADELRDYAAALGWLDTTRAPVVLAVPCNRFVPAIGPDTPGPVYVSYSYGCGRMPNPALRIVSAYTWHDWRTFTAIRDTMSLDLSGAAVARALRSNEQP